MKLSQKYFEYFIDLEIITRPFLEYDFENYSYNENNNNDLKNYQHLKPITYFYETKYYVNGVYNNQNFKNKKEILNVLSNDFFETGEVAYLVFMSLNRGGSIGCNINDELHSIFLFKDLNIAKICADILNCSQYSNDYDLNLLFKERSKKNLIKYDSNKVLFFLDKKKHYYIKNEFVDYHTSINDLTIYKIEMNKNKILEKIDINPIKKEEDALKKLKNVIEHEFSFFEKKEIENILEITYNKNNKKNHKI